LVRQRFGEKTGIESGEAYDGNVESSIISGPEAGDAGEATEE
jgi:hypothetical protein